MTTAAPFPAAHDERPDRIPLGVAVPVRPFVSRPSPANALADWIADHPMRGARRRYHRGFIAVDRRTNRDDDCPAIEVDILADLAWRHYRGGRINLVQRRRADGLYDYLAVAR